MFFDLNVAYTSDRNSVKDMVAFLITLGYDGCALNFKHNGKIGPQQMCSLRLFSPEELAAVKHEKVSRSTSWVRRDGSLQLKSAKQTGFRQLTRITVVLEDPADVASVVHPSGQNVLKSYDIVALQPTSEKVFQQIASNVDFDIISLDFSRRIPFTIRRPQVSLALQRGLFFEISVSDALKDSMMRRYMVANSLSLFRHSRGRNVLITSAAEKLMDLRGPYDLSNLGAVFGLTHEQSKAALTSACRSVISHAESRRTTFKTVLAVSSRPEDIAPLAVAGVETTDSSNSNSNVPVAATSAKRKQPDEPGSPSSPKKRPT